MIFGKLDHRHIHFIFYAEAVYSPQRAGDCSEETFTFPASGSQYFDQSGNPFASVPSAKVVEFHFGYRGHEAADRIVVQPIKYELYLAKVSPVVSCSIPRQQLPSEPSNTDSCAGILITRRSLKCAWRDHPSGPWPDVTAFNGAR